MSTIKSSAENLTLNADGANNDIKFQSNGSEVASIDQAGVIVSAGGSTHADNVKAKFGTGNDLEIYHDASHSYIKDVGTGNLYIDGANNIILRTDTGEWFARCEKDAQVALYHNNNEKLATTATGVAVTGGVAIGGTGAANTLDDYEEGTWTPVFKDSANATIGVSIYTSHYTKIGRLVNLMLYINVSALQNGLLTSATLPFAPINNERTAGSITTYNCPITDDSSINNAVYIENELRFWRLKTSAASIAMKVYNGSEIMVGISYMTA